MPRQGKDWNERLQASGAAGTREPQGEPDERQQLWQWQGGSGDDEGSGDRLTADN